LRSEAILTFAIQVKNRFQRLTSLQAQNLFDLLDLSGINTGGGAESAGGGI
jgi:hypothetical protein